MWESMGFHVASHQLRDKWMQRKWYCGNLSSQHMQVPGIIHHSYATRSEGAAGRHEVFGWAVLMAVSLTEWSWV